MGKVDAVIGDMHGPGTPQAQSFTRAQMGEMYFGEADIPPEPEYKVFLYTVSKQEHIVQQAPLIPYLIIPACKDDDQYKLVIEIPHPMLQVERHPDKNEAIFYRHKAERVAQSICNPDNASLDQDFVSKRPSGAGINLNAKGVFWSRNNPPTEKEIKKAHARIERYYAGLIEQARQLELVDPKALLDVLNQDYHFAAEHFGLETSWHRKLIAKAECPVCYAQIDPRAAVCRSCGAMIDPDKAKRHGVTEESFKVHRASRGTKVQDSAGVGVSRKPKTE